MKVLIDTNLLTRLAVTSDPQHAIAIQAILKLDQADCEIWHGSRRADSGYQASSLVPSPPALWGRGLG